MHEHWRNSSDTLLFSAHEILVALKTLQLENQDLLSEDLMIKGMEVLLKEFQLFPDEIRKKIDEIYPLPPPKEKNTDVDELDVMTGKKKCNS